MRVLNKDGLLGKPNLNFYERICSNLGIRFSERVIFLCDGCWVNPSLIFGRSLPPNMIPFNGLALTNCIDLLGKPKVNGN